MISIQLEGDSITSWKLSPFSSEYGPESELQTLVEEHPELLPWEALGLSSRLVVLAREVQTPDGKLIDHLAADLAGRVYVLECKIVANHELRSVIAQALEYAAQLSSLTTREEFLTTIKRDEEELAGLVGADGFDDFLKGLDRTVREADYGIIIITDYAGNSPQANVNGKTVEYLRPVTEIHLVEVAKYENEAGGKLFVPQVTARGPPRQRRERALEVWKKNLIKALGSNPGLQAAMLDYLQWVQEINPDQTRVTPKGVWSSFFKGQHYIAFMEPNAKGSGCFLWVSRNVPSSESELARRWEKTFESFHGRLGESSGKNYYLVNSGTDPQVIRNHHELQQQLVQILLEHQEKGNLSSGLPGVEEQ